eukprot:gnl/TRDRNA2_/TRDRNA2_176128_c2_seq3.p1 gnl/TRDRNA2_/TRDRNA2_176128_c2~~gnl/TRDRNA2_/TRDRNA2_176128_c2_seq3.p1  ORF type:complete len:370 (-),score=82.06 gnl/TRDRNA2_/TRDRNA2_176128_c2_seq3:56-1165(-)
MEGSSAKGAFIPPSHSGMVVPPKMPAAEPAKASAAVTPKGSVGRGSAQMPASWYKLSEDAKAKLAANASAATATMHQRRHGAPPAFGIKTPVDAMPAFRWQELKDHLRYLLEAEEKESQEAIIAAYPITSEHAPAETGADASASEHPQHDAGNSADATSKPAEAASAVSDLVDGTSNPDGASKPADAASNPADAAAECPAAGAKDSNPQTPPPKIEAAEMTTPPNTRRPFLLTPAWKEGARAAAELAMRRKLAKAQEGDKLELSLSQIRYSQDSVKGFFRDLRTVSQMRKELATGEKSVDEIPTITVVAYGEDAYSVDNRRLWSFKNCGMPSSMRIPVIAGRVDTAFFNKMTSPTGGLTVRRRGEQGFG